MVAYTKQTGSDEWGGEETETYRELTGYGPWILGQGATVCNVESLLILNRQLSPSDAHKFGLDQQM